MNASLTYVIIGAGQAGGRAAETLRAEGFAGRVVVVGAEAYVPYERPPLSKQLLKGEEGPERAFLHPPEYYPEKEIELRLGCRAEAIDARARRVSLSDGETLGYDKLLITTGSRVRKLDLPGAELPGIHYLRDLGDCFALRRALTPGAALAVIGGGYIGLEVAAAARARGCRVTVLEMAPEIMSRQLAPEVGAFMAELHRAAGVEIRTGVAVTGLAGAGRVERILSGDDAPVEADVVVIGVGIEPETGLAESAGLALDNGIVVDERGRTSEPRIFAAGDVTNHPNPLLGRRLRLESWQNAQNQAIAAARAMCGREQAYAEVPWFWSDQYDVNLQMVGLPERWERLVFRGEVGAHKFTVFYLEDDRVVAANAVNQGRDIRPARQLIAERRPVDAERLADPGVSLKTLLVD
ncbi:MAG: FAD-dependent oxidoreductase [Alphaproteobacteria bacterium]|nr:FAD-dependent oxidoreductase [Alphaproteobacteria bacterium]